ncbi:MAG: VCBS repeat-containing protein [Planctomycetes bacterium]|nr:VCBS repeat-containing protein [Planctomycetota bacterium]
MKIKLITTLAFCLLLSLPIAAQQVTFEEVTQSSGLVMSYYSRWSTDMAWGDYDNDGNVDVYITSWGQATTGLGQNALYRNTGSGTFYNVGATTGTDLFTNSKGAAWGDFDNDGDLDLFVANFAEGDIVFKNMLIETGSASFSNVTSAMSFENESTGNSMGGVWGDYDNDGFLDLYVPKLSGKNALYKNSGGTSFSLQTGDFQDVKDSEKARFSDYDDDGDVDLYVVNKEQENSIFRNEDGVLTKVDIGINDTQFGRNAVWADYDNNNTLDLFLSNIGANSFYVQSPGSNRSFSEVAGLINVKSASAAWDTWGATFGDYDGDGDLDLFFVGGFDEVAPSSDLTDKGTYGNILLENTGGGFTNATSAAGLITGANDYLNTIEVGSFASSAAFVDYDNDGDLDLMVTNTMQNLFFKNTKDDNNFLKVRVQGGGDGYNNYNGIGAKVRVKDASSSLVVAMREIMSGPEPLTAHFGLTEGTLYNIEVTFLKNGSSTPETITLSNVTVPLDTVIIQQ